MTTYSSVQGSKRPVDSLQLADAQPEDPALEDADVVDAELADAELEDPAFIARLRAAGEAAPRAVEELVREFQPNLTAYARSRRFPDPDGVVNETLSDGLQNLPTFRGRDRRAFRAYLYRILRRRIVDEYRRSARQPHTVADSLNDLDTRLVDETASSFDEDVVAESMVDDILAQLTTEQREVLEMRVLTGLSIRETADLTGRSETAVKAMHRRALRSLRTFFVAAAILILAVLSIRTLGLGRTVTVIDNSPADDGGQSLGLDPDAPVPVVEVNLDPERPDPSGRPPDSAGTPRDGDGGRFGRDGGPDGLFMVVGDSISVSAAPAPTASSNRRRSTCWGPMNDRRCFPAAAAPLRSSTVGPSRSSSTARCSANRATWRSARHWPTVGFRLHV